MFDVVREAVTARQAAEFYGLEIDRHGKARCPWHSPDRHPSLSFKGGRCRCFACNNGGSSIDLTAQLFGLSPLDACRKLAADFKISAEPVRPLGPSKALQRREAEAWQRERWAFLCEVERQAIGVLEGFKASDRAWADPRFRAALKALGRAQLDLERLFIADVGEGEEIRREVKARVGRT